MRRGFLWQRLANTPFAVPGVAIELLSRNRITPLATNFVLAIYLECVGAQAV
jgi:hypothetical protein